eukprot:gene12854-27100_t
MSYYWVCGNYNSPVISCYALAILSCLACYLPIFMNLKLDIPDYGSLEAVPLSNTLHSPVFKFSVIFSIGATVPMLVDYIFDVFSSRGRVFHPAKPVICLLFFSSLILNSLEIGYIAPDFRLSYWAVTHPLKISMLFTSGLYILHSYGPSIWRLEKIIPILIFLYVGQMLQVLVPFKSPFGGNELANAQKVCQGMAFAIFAHASYLWLKYIHMKFLMGIKNSTDDLYCTMNLITLVITVTLIWSLAFVSKAATNKPLASFFELDVISVTIQTYLLTTYTIILTVLNVRYIRSKLEYEKTKQNIPELIEDLQGSCQSAVDILNDLLVYEGLSEGDNVQMVTKRINMETFLEQKITALKTQARQKGINLELTMMERSQSQRQLDGHELKHACIDADEEKIGQVIRHLVSNAIEFTPNNETVSISVEGLKCNNSNSNNNHIMNLSSQYHLRISIQDRGPGLSKENQKAVFQNALRFTAGVLQTLEGKGLGLWISRRIVQLHRGDLYIHSDGEGLGCTFIIELPIHEFINERPLPQHDSRVGLMGLVRQYSRSTRSRISHSPSPVGFQSHSHSHSPVMSTVTNPSRRTTSLRFITSSNSRKILADAVTETTTTATATVDVIESKVSLPERSSLNPTITQEFLFLPLDACI